MSVTDYMIKGWQDSQARNDTLKDRALQLKQLQEEKVRQAQQDAQNLLFKKIEFSRQELSTKELWNAADEDPSVLAPHMAIADEAAELGFVYKPTDSRPQLFAQEISKMLVDVADGKVLPEVGWRQFRAGYTSKFLNQQMQPFVDQAKASGKVGSLDLTTPYKPNLRAIVEPVAPEFKPLPTGDIDVDATLASLYQTSGIEGIKTLANTPATASSKFSVAAKASLDEFNKLDSAYQLALKNKKSDEDFNLSEMKKEAMSKRKSAFVSKIIGDNPELNIDNVGMLILADRLNVAELEKKLEAWRKVDINQFTSPGAKRLHYEQGVEYGEIDPSVTPFEEWSTNPYEQLQKSKATATEVKQAYDRTVQMRKDIASKVKFASTQEEAMSIVPDKDTYALWLDENIVNESMGRPTVPYNKANYITTFGQTVNEQENTKYKYYNLQQQQTMFDTKEKIQSERYKVEDAFRNRSISNDEYNTKLRELQVMADLLDSKSKKPVAVKSYQPKFTPAIDNLSFSYEGKTVKANPEWVFAFEPGENGQRYKYPKAAEIAQSIASYLQQSATLMPDENGDLVMKPGMMQVVQDALPGASDIKPKLAQLITSLNNEVAKISAGGSTETAPTLYSPNIPPSTPVVGSDGVGRKDKFTPISADYEVYKAKNGLWYQRSKYKSGSKNTGARPAQGGGLAPGDTVITIKGPNGKPMKVIRRGKK